MLDPVELIIEAYFDRIREGKLTKLLRDWVDQDSEEDQQAEGLQDFVRYLYKIANCNRQEVTEFLEEEFSVVEEAEKQKSLDFFNQLISEINGDLPADHYIIKECKKLPNHFDIFIGEEMAAEIIKQKAATIWKGCLNEFLQEQYLVLYNEQNAQNVQEEQAAAFADEISAAAAGSPSSSPLEPSSKRFKADQQLARFSSNG